MKLNSPSIIRSRLIETGKEFAKAILGVLTVCLGLVTIHVVARYLYATVGYFDASQWICHYGFGCFRVGSEIPWYQLDFKTEQFWNYSGDMLVIFTTHFLAAILLALIGCLVYGLWSLLFQPSTPSKPTDSIIEPRSMRRSTRYASGIERACACANHYTSRAEAYDDDDECWHWSAVCDNPTCACLDHFGDRKYRTRAPEFAHRFRQIPRSSQL